MKKLLTAISVMAGVRLIMTVMLLVKSAVYSAFSMFSIPFFLAKAYESPRIAVILLFSYLLFFLVSSVLIYIKKMRVIGCSLYILVFFSDLICIVSSFVRGNSYYILAGVPFCILGMTLLAVTMKREIRHRKAQ